MSARWIRLDTTWSQSDWIASLEPAERLVWVELLCYAKAHGMAGVVRSLTDRVAARLWGVTESNVRNALRSAVADGALVIGDGETGEEGDWIITGWSRFQGDGTGAERQKRYRRSKSRLSPSRVTPVTDRDATSRDVTTTAVTPTKTETETKTEQNTDSPLTSFAPNPGDAASRRAPAREARTNTAPAPVREAAPAPPVRVVREEETADSPFPAPRRPSGWIGRTMPMLREAGFFCDDTDGSILKALEGRIGYDELEAAVCGLALLRDEGGLRPSLGIEPGDKLSLRALYAKPKAGDDGWTPRPLWREAVDRFERSVRTTSNPHLTLHRVSDIINEGRHA